jgi:hypothetical protein
MSSGDDQRTRSDDFSFDPDAAFNDVKYDPDDPFIKQRRQAEIEREKRLEEETLARRLERQRLEEEEREQERERRRRETEREERRRMEAEEHERKREEDLRLLPERMEVIKSHARRYDNLKVKWPHPLTARELRVDPEEFVVMHKNLKLGGGRLQEPIPDDYDEELNPQFRRMEHKQKHSHKLDTLPPLFELREQTLLQDFNAGRLYIKLCKYFHEALRHGLYKYDSNLAKNLENKYTKRLRSYYQCVDWDNYDRINLLDGWTKLFQILLIIEPDQDTDSMGVIRFLRAIEEIHNLFCSTTTELNKFSSDDMFRNEPDSISIIHVIEKSKFGLLEYSNASKLNESLQKRSKEIHSLYSAHELYDVKEMRRITEEIIMECAQFFVDEPHNVDVKLLRSIAFGHLKLDFEKMKMAWMNALKNIPEEVFSRRSKLWKQAAEWAGVRLYDGSSKHYYT